MDRHITWIVVGTCFACLAVILGAFAAHGLKSKISTEDLAIFETGVRYQMYHSLGLILLGLIGFQTAQDIVFFPALMFIIGIIIFSGTLYLIPMTGLRWLCAVTPIGGTAFILGWSFLIYNLIKVQ